MTGDTNEQTAQRLTSHSPLANDDQKGENKMRKQTIILISGVLAILAATILLLLLPGSGLSAHAAPAGDLQVCPSGCTYSSIQAAVDAADPGDVIKVAAGVYTDVHARGGITQVVYISETVTLRGGYSNDFTTRDPNVHPTTLDAQGQGRALAIIGYGISPTIEGLHITGGVTPEPLIRGGGVYVEDASGVISGNVIYSNTASYYGGGVYLSWSSARLVNNTIQNNTSTPGLGSGGGLYLDSDTSTLENNVIENNASLSGAGVHMYKSNATLEGNTITDNTAGQGGGIYIIYGHPTLSANVINANAASVGGGLYLHDSEPLLVNNAIIDNQGLWLGAGICATEGSIPRLLHTTIARNGGGDTGDGSGIYVTDNPYDIGHGVSSALLMTNTILVNHTVGITVATGSTATLNATLWHANGGGNWGSTGSINHTNDHTGDPGFKSDGYHLVGRAGAIDQGVNAGVTTDIDGETRPIDAGYDLGADETVALHFIYLPLVMRTSS
jgi:parallel beta-helix repeat protein